MGFVVKAGCGSFRIALLTP
nr:hypothetical protein [Vibrio cholerae]